MPTYRVSAGSPSHHFLHIRFEADVSRLKQIDIRLPKWRPGRYELANFAKNVRGFNVLDSEGNNVPFAKVDSHTWRVDGRALNAIAVEYEYYANELNAGSTYVDDQQVYINPVNCFVYLDEQLEDTCVVDLSALQHKQVACSLAAEGQQLRAASFHELVDSPFIVSDALQHDAFTIGQAGFVLWFLGEAKPDFERIKRDFTAFAVAQEKSYGGFPFEEFHFLFQVPHYRTYHGVEHQKSTVIALGPGYKLMHKSVYDEFMGVSCHELYHVWNIKAIRPAEMQPYNYARENYSRLGYVAEGVTTYYGDLYLLRSGYFSPKELFTQFARHAQRHFHNFGRQRLSVADSGYDTWLDGYVAGIPHRKLSIYSDGALLALICDAFILEQTRNAKSLDDAMRILYERFGKSGVGYTEDDYWTILEEVAGTSMQEMRAQFVDAANDYGNALEHSLDYIGCKLVAKSAKNSYETTMGFKVDSKFKVVAVHPNSPAERAGLAVDDELLGINNYKLEADLADWIAHFQDSGIGLAVSKRGAVSHHTIEPDGQSYYQEYAIERVEHPSAGQKAAWQAWSWCD